MPLHTSPLKYSSAQSIIFQYLSQKITLMHREDDSKYLLYIEPSSALKDEVPITDNITSAMDYMLSNAIPGTARYSNLTDKGTFNPRNGWKGLHTTECGTHSDPFDYLLPNGMITNSLCVFYLTYYRRAIPNAEWKKIDSVAKWVQNNTAILSQF